MSFSSMKTFAVLQLLLVLLGSFNGGQTLAKALDSNNHPPSKPVAVQGMVYCKSCKYLGVDNLTNATGISGAVVKLSCHNTKHVKNIVATTDTAGYFYLEAPHTVATYGAYKCQVSLYSVPTTSSCQTKTNINNGTTGATLRYEESSTNSAQALYNVGPFALDPSSNC